MPSRQRLRNLSQCSDEEEAQDERETPEGGDAGGGPEDGGEGEGSVKKDPDMRQSREHTPSHELRTYQEAELRSFKRSDLAGDVAYLDGMYTVVQYITP